LCSKLEKLIVLLHLYCFVVSNNYHDHTRSARPRSHEKPQCQLTKCQLTNSAKHWDLLMP
jgi:hypothetical protein